MIKVPKKWQQLADEAEKKGANLSVIGKNFNVLRDKMSPEQRAKSQAKTKEMLDGMATGWRFMELLWYRRGKVLVIKTMDPKNMVKFLRGFGLKFAKEKHGDGPVHYACQIGTRVLEVYPHD